MKLHNMQRDESFQYKIVKPNSTRWNSHLHAAQRVFERLGGASVVPLDAATYPLVRLALSGTLASTVS